MLALQKLLRLPLQNDSAIFQNIGPVADLQGELHVLLDEENPHAAAVDAKGHYAIKNVPPGTWQLAVWNAKLKGPEKSVTVAAGKTVEENLTVKR